MNQEGPSPGSCLLRVPDHRNHLKAILEYGEGTLAKHHAWVIMPNHVHLLFTPRHPLEKLIRKWKGIPARRIGKDSICQCGYRDTLIRDKQHFANAVRYIRHNPANLPASDFTLYEAT